MRYFPMFLDMAGRAVLLAGGGEQVAQKARLLSRSDARLLIMAEDLNQELSTLVENGEADHAQAVIDPEALAAADFVFIATEDENLDTKIAEIARAGGALVNIVDTPDQCDMITPALVDRDPVVVAIGTEGAAPVVAKSIKTTLEQSLSPQLGGFVSMIRQQRELVAKNVDGKSRLAFWNWALKGGPWRMWLDGDEAGAEAAVRAAAEKGAPPEGELSALTFIEAPAAPDLLPLRAVQRLQDATTVVHAPDLDSGVLELARRDAERMVLSACPRSSPHAIAEALEKGPVVVIATRDCDWPGLAAERIAAAPE